MTSTHDIYEDTEKNDSLNVSNSGVSSENDYNVFISFVSMPEFPGGEKALRSFIKKNTNYPEALIERGIEGKVYVTFVIDKEGNVKRPRIARGLDSLLDMEAIRVVNAFPKWKPGTNCQKKEAFSYTVPISFSLSEKE